MNVPLPALTEKVAAASSDLLTTKEACALLRCARSTLYALFHRKEVKKAKIGGAMLAEESAGMLYRDADAGGKMTPPTAHSDLADLLHLLAVRITKGESVRDVVDYCRRRVETASCAELPSVKAPTKLSALLTTEEAAEYLGVHRNTLARLWKRKKVKHKTSAGNRVMWRRSELDAYLERQTRAAR